MISDGGVRTPSDAKKFSRVILHSVLASKGYGVRLFVAHIESDGVHSIKFLTTGGGDDDHIWNSLKVKSLAAGIASMDEYRSSPNLIKKTLKNLDISWVPRYADPESFESYGFSRLTTSHAADRTFAQSKKPSIPSDWAEIDILSQGNYLAELLSLEGYSPTSVDEIEMFWDYLSKNGMRVGLFGNFKFVLKGLSKRFLVALDHEKPEVLSAWAGCLGSAFGQVEAYLSKGPHSPKHYLTRKSSTSSFWMLDTLPALGETYYPSLATSQYLSRMGLRVFKRLAQDTDSDYATRFEVNLLHVADEFDENSEQFPEYQVVVGYMVTQGARVSRGDISNRRLSEKQLKSVKNYSPKAKLSPSCGVAQKQLYGSWVSNLTANNPLIARYAFNLYRLYALDFPWTPRTVALLSRDSSPLITNEVLGAISQNPKLFLALGQEEQNRYADLLPLPLLKEIYSFGNASLGRTAVQRLSELSKAPFRREHLELVKILLNNYQFEVSYLIPEVDRRRIYVNLAQVSQLEPLESWAASFELELWLKDFIPYLGTDSGMPGIFDVLDNPSDDVMRFFAAQLGEKINFYHRDEEDFLADVARDSLLELLSSGNPKLVKLASITVLDLLEEELVVRFLKTSQDNGLVLEIIQAAVAANNAVKVLCALRSLDDQETGALELTEGQKLTRTLVDWAGFPEFFWDSLDRIPDSVVKGFLSFPGFGAVVIHALNVSDGLAVSGRALQILSGLLDSDDSSLNDSRLLKSCLMAQSSRLNVTAVSFAKRNDQMSRHWLMMIESNLPVPTTAAVEYLQSMAGATNFRELLLAALDSDNRQTRQLALGVMRSAASPEDVHALAEKLVENRHPDVWETVRENLEFIKDANARARFTSGVFLSRRKARSEKERIKVAIDQMVTEISEALDADTLLRMSLSSISKDREWALKQIALGALQSDSVAVETTWKSSRYV